MGKKDVCKDMLYISIETIVSMRTCLILYYYTLGIVINNFRQLHYTDLFPETEIIYNLIGKWIISYYNVSGGPIMSTSHWYMSLSSMRPAENPSTGFLFNSIKKKKVWIKHVGFA